MEILHREDLFLEQSIVDDERDSLRERENQLEALKKEKVAINNEERMLLARRNAIEKEFVKAMQILIIPKICLVKFKIQHFSDQQCLRCGQATSHCAQRRNRLQIQFCENIYAHPKKLNLFSLKSYPIF